MPASRGATLSIGICSACKSPQLGKERGEAIMIYKTEGGGCSPPPSPFSSGSDGWEKIVIQPIYCCDPSNWRAAQRRGSELMAF